MNIEATIIVMVYKNLNQVIQTLDSIKKQTYSNYEVIVSDDGSPNYTQEDFDKITEQYKNEFTYFKLINNGINRGTVKHFNSLIKQAKGTIICPLSSGDQFYNENSLQEIMNVFDQEDKLIYTSKRMIKKENSIEYYPSLYQVSLLDQSNHFFEYIMKYGNFVSGASTYYKKDIFDKYGFFDEKYRLLEDYPFYAKLALNNEKIGYLDYPTIQYELGGISTASNRNPLLDQDYVTLFKDVLSQKDIHLSYTAKRALKYRIDKITKKYNSFVIQLLYIDVVIMLGLNKIGIIKG
ncbi:MAG: glycosyltransferase [Coprobacillus sp.]|jgi:GT2 family glycosyltransferase|nr:glycosyltransferase [Coprobacillus sp.]